MDYRISYTPYTLVKFEYKGYNGIKDKSIRNSSAYYRIRSTNCKVAFGFHYKKDSEWEGIFLSPLDTE